MRTGRRRRRSTHAPATSPNDERRDEVDGRAGSRPRSRPAEDEDRRERQRDPGDERPKIEIVAAAQTRTKAWLRQSGEANGLRTDGGA